MSEKELELKLITPEELMEGLKVITKGNLGFARWLFEQVINKTREETEIVLEDISDNFKTYKRRARDAATRELKANMAASPWHGPQPARGHFSAPHRRLGRSASTKDIADSFAI